jgi:hypothetical protein
MAVMIVEDGRTTQYSSAKQKQKQSQEILERRGDSGHDSPNAPHIKNKKKKKKSVPWTQRIKVTNPVDETEEGDESIDEGIDEGSELQETETRSHETYDIPITIRNDEAKVKLWEKATDEERMASELLCDFQASTAKTGIGAYFDFADKWNTVFPTNSKKAYERGLSVVKKASRIAGVSASSIYSILKTTKFYGRNGYESLAKKAATNGVVIEWTQLRTLANRLADNKEARTEIEREIIQRKVTEAQLNALIDERAPETIHTRAGQTTKRSSLSLIDALNVDLTRFVRSDEALLNAIQDIDDNYKEQDHENIVKICNKTLDLFKKVMRVIEKRAPELKNLVDAVNIQMDVEARTAAAKSEKAETKTSAKAAPAKSKQKNAEQESLEERAEKIKKRVADEQQKTRAREQERAERVALFGDFSDDNDPPQRSVRRPKPKPILDHLPDEEDNEEDNYDKYADTSTRDQGIEDSDEGYYDDEEEDNETGYDEEYNEDDEDDEDSENESSDEDYNEDDDDSDEEYDDDEESFHVSERDAADIFDENGDIT